MRTISFQIASAAALLAGAAAAAGSGGSADRRDPSVREEQAARQEAKRGLLRDVDAAQLERNRLARCDRLPEEERGYCIRRMNGEGTVSGSVEGGGILRELRVQIPED